jgi:small-conductance mechanosensitive channel/CRP-like cAMP-binding protein
MQMKHKILPFVLWLIFLAFLVLIADVISVTNKGTYYYLEQFTQTFIIMLATWTTLHVFRKIIWPLYEEKKGKAVPHLIIDMTDFVIIIIGIFVTIVYIFQESIFSVAAAGGLITAALAISLQGVIQDIFGSLVIDIDVPYKIGDWLKLSNGIEGKVEHISWRQTSLLTHDQTIVHVPNSMMISEEVNNLSQPHSYLKEEISLTLDGAIPIARVKRILEAATMELSCIYNHQAQVFAYQIESGSVTYVIKYMIPDRSVWRSVRHKVLDAVSKAMVTHHIETSTTVIEYIKNEGNSDLKEDQTLTLYDYIRLNKLFQNSEETIISKIAKIGNFKQYTEESIILQQGESSNSLYLIAEGAVNIQLQLEEKSSDLKALADHTQNSQDQNMVAVLGSFDFFGERGLYLNEPRNSTVVAKTDLFIIEIRREDIIPIFHEHPELVDTIAKIIAIRDKERELYVTEKTPLKDEHVLHLFEKIKVQMQKIL